MKFSIILPTYNRAETFLKEAIDSIVSQSYKNWELLIIDNHSEDNTDELINSYKDSRIKTYKIKNDGNIAKSRNLGINRSSGEYIALIDSDDFWHKDKLKVSHEYLDKNKTKGLCHSEYWLDETGQSQIRHYGTKGFSYNSLLINGNNLSLSAVIVHKYILENLDGFSENSDHITAEDYDLWLKLAKSNYKIEFIKNILGTFRVHQSSESRDVLKNIKAICSVIKDHCRQDNIDHRSFRTYIANTYNIAGKIFQLRNLKYESLKYYIKSIKLNPIQIKSYLMIITLLLPLVLLKFIRNLK